MIAFRQNSACFLDLKYPDICLKHPYLTHKRLIFILEAEFPYLIMTRPREVTLRDPTTLVMAMSITLFGLYKNTCYATILTFLV